MAIKLQCPFCGTEVKPEAANFRWVTITTREAWAGAKDAPRQDFGCHADCLDRLLGNHLPLL